VIAFGGSRSAMQLPDATTSIFRLRGDARKKQVYAQKLQNRYYLSGSMLSWEVRIPFLFPFPGLDSTF